MWYVESTILCNQTLSTFTVVVREAVKNLYIEDFPICILCQPLSASKIFASCTAKKNVNNLNTIVIFFWLDYFFCIPYIYLTKPTSSVNGIKRQSNWLWSSRCLKRTINCGFLVPSFRCFFLIDFPLGLIRNSSETDEQWYY